MDTAHVLSTLSPCIHHSLWRKTALSWVVVVSGSLKCFHTYVFRSVSVLHLLPTHDVARIMNRNYNEVDQQHVSAPLTDLVNGSISRPK